MILREVVTVKLIFLLNHSYIFVTFMFTIGSVLIFDHYIITLLFFFNVTGKDFFYFSLVLADEMDCK